jgi:hypothetical protein
VQAGEYLGHRGGFRWKFVDVGYRRWYELERTYGPDRWAPVDGPDVDDVEAAVKALRDLHEKRTERDRLDREIEGAVRHVEAVKEAHAEPSAVWSAIEGWKRTQAVEHQSDAS